MKTIETASDEQSYNFIYDDVDYSHPNFVANEKKQSFQDGVEFAQRWIPIEEQLPENDSRTLLLVKHENGNIYITTYFNSRFFLADVTHWRPIELK